MIGRFQDRVEKLNSLIEQSMGVFDKALPSFSIFFEKYPFDYQILQQKYPENWQQIEQLQKQAGETQDDVSLEQINHQIQSLEFSLYLQYLSEQNPKLAQILQQLVSANGDFGVLSEGDLTFMMQEFVGLTLEKYKDKNLTQVFEQMGGSGFEPFFRDLFDFQKNTLNI